MKKKLSLLLVLLILSACAVSPTGRKQLAFMPESQMESMGIQSFEQLKQETPQVENPAINAYVQCVADAITSLPQVQQYSSEWVVEVFDQDMVNAFALPGGRIGVYRGLLTVAETPDQLAAVLGHEVAHVLAQHGNERVSQNLAVSQTLALVEDWMAANNTAYRQQAMGLLGVGAQVGVLLPFSRVHESEADKIGQTLMAKAGFDPRASVALWQNMSRASGESAPEFLSTHPSHESRIDQLQAGMEAAMQHYRAVQDKPSCPVPAAL